YTQPDVAVISNVGAAHIEGFGSLGGVARAKGEIIQSLSNQGVAILNRDDEFYKLWLEIAEDRKVVSFGLNKSADIRAEDIVSGLQNNEFVTRFKLITTTSGKIEIQLKLAGRHNVSNALAAAASCMQMDIGLQQIKQGLENLKPVTGRLQPLVGEQGSLVLDDTYNANPSSVKVALDVLLQCEGESWVVLGALGEMGADSLEIHKELGELIKSMNVVRLLTIGSDAESTSHIFGRGATFFTSQEALIATLKQEIKGRECILIKGSRAQKMENVVAALVTNFRK
ncbi:MAG: UDP-N-acetylmuramoyl-tripeptide--D-alanyl-D-alanine ligase, partial [Methylococcales bacterium]|nr:UDP-N-acetylmuramoyl-tripeptide--D-alanyl-D-alanine ligase [Methylococcales bacterium]